MALRFETFRKPRNLYMYLPYGSTHRQTHFQGIVRSETARYFATNDCESSFQKHVDIFLEKFAERGHSFVDARKLAQDIANKCRTRQSTTNTVNDADNTRKVYMSFTCSGSVDAKWVQQQITDLQHLINPKVMICYSIQKSMFRKLYSLNWGRFRSSSAAA